MSAFTDEQILDAIAETLRDRDFETAIALTRVLALQNPAAAQDIVDVVTLAASGSTR